MSAPRLRVAWIAPTFQLDASDEWSPGLTALAHRIADQHELIVYALDGRGGRERFRIGEVQVRAFSGGVGGLPGTAQALLAETRARRPDVVHALWATQPALVGAVVASVVRRPLV